MTVLCALAGLGLMWAADWKYRVAWAWWAGFGGFLFGVAATGALLLGYALVVLRDQHRRLDAASLALLMVGVVSGGFAYWLITNRGMNPLVLVPSVMAATTGASHLFKRQAPRG